MCVIFDDGKNLALTEGKEVPMDKDSLKVEDYNDLLR
jgi:hypothetical protein